MLFFFNINSDVYLRFYYIYVCYTAFYLYFCIRNIAIELCCYMRKYLKYNGLAFVYFGAFFLIISSFMGWLDSNLVLFTPLFLIIIGIVLHVKVLRNDSKY